MYDGCFLFWLSTLSASDKKATTDLMIFKNKLLEVKEQYYTHEDILGSKKKVHFLMLNILKN